MNMNYLLTFASLLNVCGRGSWWFGSFLTAKNGHQYFFMTSAVFGLESRNALLDLTTLERFSWAGLTNVTIAAHGLEVTAERFSLTSDVPNNFSRMRIVASIPAQDNATQDAVKVNMTLTPEWPILYNMVCCALNPFLFILSLKHFYMICA
jgi:hypothetical protein